MGNCQLEDVIVNYKLQLPVISYNCRVVSGVIEL